MTHKSVKALLLCKYFNTVMCVWERERVYFPLLHHHNVLLISQQHRVSVLCVLQRVVLSNTDSCCHINHFLCVTVCLLFLSLPASYVVLGLDLIISQSGNDLKPFFTLAANAQSLSMVPSCIVSVCSSALRTSVKTSYMVRTSQNSLEAYRYIDCGANTTYHQTADSLSHPPLL